ncbi:MAG: DUF3558 domain-containing protein [Rhodococcus sp.]|nr:DUF3558 domain-containing protein [Rhodococcus sp. (in: high G+C Gram-positive bacteria)]
MIFPRRAASCVVAVAALSLTACTSSEQAAAPPELPPLTFHPCDGFGPDARAAAGIDGADIQRYEDREEPFQARPCSYRSDDPYSSVLISSNRIRLSKAENDERYTLVQDTTVAGHRTLITDFPGGLQCKASVDFDPNVLEVMVGYKQGDIETPEQACSLALQVVEDLAPYFPDHL